MYMESKNFTWTNFATKGLLARHVLESHDAPINALETWEHPRFTLTY
jgi:hypothetical protein